MMFAIITIGFSIGLLSMAVATVVLYFREKKKPVRHWQIKNEK